MSDLLKVKVGGSDYLCKWEEPGVVIGGRRYKTVKIGNQEWLAESLDYVWTGLNVGGYNGTEPSIESAWYYDNDETLYGFNGRKCGLLYNGLAVLYLENNKNILLPNRWRIPTIEDFSTLATTVGGVSIAGKKLKALDSEWIIGWKGTNTYGFNAVPSGRRLNGTFSSIGKFSTYWCYENASVMPLRFFSKDTNSLNNSESGITRAYSLRLVKSLT